MLSKGFFLLLYTYKTNTDSIWFLGSSAHFHEEAFHFFVYLSCVFSYRGHGFILYETYSFFNLILYVLFELLPER